MNDQGLFIDGNGLNRIEWSPKDEQPNFNGIVEEYVLAHHATVAEAVQWFEQTNVTILSRAKFLLADKTGASVAIEWADSATIIIPRVGNYQISTNFRHSNYSSGNYPCYRYRMSDAMLRERETFSVDLLRQVLSATHFEGDNSTTLSSYICDLTDGWVNIYNFHNFKDVVVFELD